MSSPPSRKKSNPIAGGEALYGSSRQSLQEQMGRRPPTYYANILHNLAYGFDRLAKIG